MIVKSEIAGQIWKTVAQVGQELKVDDTIVIIESMKMEIFIESPANGSVHSILKTEGELVKTGEFLLFLKTGKEKDS